MKITDPVHRLDSAEKLKGQALYIEDCVFEGLLYAKTLRSTEAHAKIVGIDYPPPEEGIFVIDAKDVISKNEVAMIDTAMPVFASDAVTYLGEPIALVLSESKDAVVRYFSKITVRYDPLPAYFSPEEALNVPDHVFTDHTFQKGNIDALDYDDTLTETFETGYQEQLYMEKQGLVATYENDIITVYGSLQCPYYVLNALKHTTGFGEDRLRVIQSVTGGAFGGKEEYPSLIACQVATAAYRLKKPVQLVFDRREDMAFTTKRHPSRSILTSYLKAGRVVGMSLDLIVDAGSYIGLSDVVLQRAILTMTGSYAIDHLKVRGRTVKTNNVFTGAFRGFGAPQSMYALELHMSHLARRVGEDPLAFRQKHFVKQGDTTATSGIFNEPILLDDLIALLKDMSGYSEKMKTHGKWVGYGVSVIPHGGGFTGDGEATHIKATVKLRREKDGVVTLLVSNVEMGQGAITTLSKIVASVLECPIENIRYHVPDTAVVPDSGPTVASRTTMVVGALLEKAARQLKALKGPVTVTEHFKQPGYIKWDQSTLTGNAYMAYSWSAVLVRVEVDPVTYEVKCTDVWGAYDVGVPIDEKLLLGQIHGGVVQGLGYALMEHMTSEGGLIQQTAFSSYPIPTALDVPKMHAKWLMNPYQDGPFGAKAVGELTLVGVAPAVSAAIEDAIGKSTYHIPMTPEAIERTLR